jgi:Tol biopolymer transport system component
MDADGRHPNRVMKAGGGQDPSAYGQPLLSPDGRKVLVAERGLTVAWLATGVRKHLGPGDESTASWAPDSWRIAFSGVNKGGLSVVDVRSGRRRTLRRTPTNWSPAWSPDGEMDHTAAEPAWVYVVRRSGGRPRFISEYAPTPSDRLTWSVDGKLAFFGSYADLTGQASSTASTSPTAATPAASSSFREPS